MKTKKSINFTMGDCGFLQCSVCNNRAYFLLLALVFFACAGLRAQVTIGGLTDPQKGAILDLNSTLRGGLVLSNVALDNLYTIPYTGVNPFPGITDATTHDAAKSRFTGAMVYHIGANNISAGVYIWNGENWTPLNEDCRSLTSAGLTLKGTLWTPMNAPVTFSASNNSGGYCSDAIAYTWSVTPSTGVTFPDGNTGSTVKASFSQQGNYTITVMANNRYTPSGTVSKSLNISVSATLPLNLFNGIYGLLGPTCLDVMIPQTGLTGLAADIYNDRVNAFPGDNFVKTYTFVHGDDYTDLNLNLVDPAGLVDNVNFPVATGNGNASKTFTLTFKTDIRERFTVNGTDSSTVKLVANYKDRAGEDKVAYLEIRAKDGYCTCPVPKNGGGWIKFMCHNLGAEYDIISSSQLVTREHHGDWYRFGTTKHPSLANDDDTYAIDIAGGVIPNWSSDSNSYYPYQSEADWNPDYDPCPAGWRLPTGGPNSELVDVAATSGTALPSSSDWNGNVNNFEKFRQFGDYLYLPATGMRLIADGKLGFRGENGSYWSSYDANNVKSDSSYFLFFYSNMQLTSNVNNRQGISVRCVAVE
jgi:uncharacterized protein (TIGR02145 family)